MRSAELLFYAITMVAACACFALIVPPMGFAPSYTEHCIKTQPTTCKVNRIGVPT